MGMKWREVEKYFRLIVFELVYGRLEDVTGVVV